MVVGSTSDWLIPVSSALLSLIGVGTPGSPRLPSGALAVNASLLDERFQLVNAPLPVEFDRASQSYVVTS